MKKAVKYSDSEMSLDVMAFKKYQNSLKKGNTELARVYLLNAITHNARAEYLDEYISILEKEPDSSREELFNQAYDILTMAALNRPADEVEHIMSLISRLRESETNSIDTVSHGENDVSIVKSIEATLETFSWDRLKGMGTMEDPQVLDEKTAAIKQALESGLFTDEQIIELTKTLDQTQWQSEFVALKRALRTYFDVLEKEISRKANGSPSIERINALMSQISNFLTQLWLLEPAGPLDDVELRKEQKNMQKEFFELEPKARRAISQKPIEEIRKQYKRFVDAERENFTERLEAAQNTVTDIQELLARISFDKYREEAKQLLKQLANLVASFGRERYACYQRHVAGLAKKALEKFDNITVVSKTDALKILNDCNMVKVDEALLSPEASGLFQFAKSTLTAKLSMEQRAEFDYKCVVASKYKLEDF